MLHAQGIPSAHDITSLYPEGTAAIDTNLSYTITKRKLAAAKTVLAILHNPHLHHSDTVVLLDLQ